MDKASGSTAGEAFLAQTDSIRNEIHELLESERQRTDELLGAVEALQLKWDEAETARLQLVELIAGANGFLGSSIAELGGVLGAVEALLGPIIVHTPPEPEPAPGCQGRSPAAARPEPAAAAKPEASSPAKPEPAAKPETKTEAPSDAKTEASETTSESSSGAKPIPSSATKAGVGSDGQAGAARGLKVGAVCAPEAGRGLQNRRG